MAEYVTAAGFIQFDVEERDINGQTARDVTIRSGGTDGVLIRCTVWPEFADVELSKGDYIAVDGKYEERVAQNKEGANRTYRNMNVQTLAVLPGSPKAQSEVVNRPKGKSKSSF